jgi:hypothetical protein
VGVSHSPLKLHGFADQRKSEQFCTQAGPDAIGRKAVTCGNAEASTLEVAQAGSKLHGFTDHRKSEQFRTGTEPDAIRHRPMATWCAGKN